MKKIKNKFLPYNRQSVDSDDIKAVTKVLQSNWLTSGPQIKKFEKNLSNIVNAKYCVSCSSGSAALHLAILSLNLKKDDYVIVPSITFVSTANSVVHSGANVIFADVNKNNGLMELNNFEQALSFGKKRIKAIMPVHLSGQCVDNEKIYRKAKKLGITVIEDGAHAIGTTYKNKKRPITVGSCKHSSMACFSFHPIKTITTGEGGAITTNNKKVKDRLMNLRNHGILRNKKSNPWHYEINEIGYNYRMTDFQAALGSSQIKKIKTFIKKRSELAEYYHRSLSALSYFLEPIVQVPECSSSWHLYPILINFEKIGINKIKLMQEMKQKGVMTQIHYIPLYRHNVFKKKYGGICLPGAESYYEKSLSLPLFPNMLKNDVKYVVQTLTSIINKYI